MYQELKCTCTAIVLLINSVVFLLSLPSRFRKLATDIAKLNAVLLGTSKRI